jgi:uncharacterized protein
MGEPLLGRVIWYELLTNDVQGAKDFYTDIVGWTAEPFDASQPGAYLVWKRAGGAGVGGVMPIPAGMTFPPHWGMYVGVDNLESTVADVERRGGSSLSPVIDIPKVGRMRTMKDPQGAAFSIMQPATEGSSPDRAPELGEVSWHELMTTDAEAALAFYTGLFGWKHTDSMDMGEMGKYHMFTRGQALGGGMMNKPPAMAQVPPYWGFYFRVPDVHAAAARVKAKGGQVLTGPMEVPGGDWAVICMDPQGAAFSLHHKKQP